MNPLMRYFAVLWSGRTFKAYAYLLLALPLGIAYVVYTITLLSLSIGLSFIWVGIPMLVGLLMSMRGIGAAERGTANIMLDARILPPGRRRSRAAERGRQSWWLRAWDVIADSHAWKVALWTLMRLVLGVVGLAVAVAALVVPISIAAAVIQAVLIELGIGDWTFSPDSETVARTVSFWVLIGTPVLVLFMPALPWAARGLGAAHRAIARWALGPRSADIARVATERAELAEEQVRIDQELHDSIGHMITMNVIQAGAGAHVFDTDPEFARQALKNIEERGRAAMGELDRIIATIRGDQPETRAPLPGLADIEGLIASGREAGMDISATIDAPAVPNAVGRAAFTVVREALTNAAKHAPGAACRVSVGQLDDALAVAVANGPAVAGAVPAGSGGGRRGIAGMRDRIELLGGKQRIAATEGGGFEVLALVPLGARLELPDALDETWAQLRERVSA